LTTRARTRALRVEMERETIVAYFYLARRVKFRDIGTVLLWFESIDVVSAREVKVE
jgi:hypothetical protein